MIKFKTAFFAIFLALISIHSFQAAALDRSDNLDQLIKKHKLAAESKDIQSARNYEAAIMEILKGSTIYPKISTELFKVDEEVQSDWLNGDNTVYNGTVGVASSYDRTIDMKVGEDGYIYLAFCIGRTEYSNSQIKVYRSSDNGSNWANITNLGSFSYISNISMLVESRDNSVGDSTRVYVFFTSSDVSNFDNSLINVISVRRNGSGYLSRTIGTASAGNEFTSLSAVSDGAYYQNATYIGVVCNEVNNSTLNPVGLKYFLTVNWGESWTSTTFATGFNDFNPTASYKYTGDSICIAVERSFGVSDKQIRLLTTKFIPTAAYTTRLISISPGVSYQNPQITIQQASVSDSMMITCTQNNNAGYFYSTNYGYTWSTFVQPGSGFSTYKTHCASSPGGDRPFTMIWLETESGSRLNVLKGKLGFFDVINSNVNDYQSLSSWVRPVCINKSGTSGNVSAVTYAGFGPQNVYFDIESMKRIDLKLASEGYYNLSQNRLNRQDTVRVYLRNSVSPYQVIDSSVATLDPSTFSATYYLSRIRDDSYYLEVKTRNTIAVWIPLQATQSNYLSRDILTSRTGVFGQNEKVINNLLGYYGLYSGDVNQDGIVDGTDTQLIDNAATAFLSGYSFRDLNGDLFVDGTDALIASNNAYNFISVITPP